MRLLFFAPLFLLSAVGAACSCIFAADFCEYVGSTAEWTDGNVSVVRVRFLEFRSPDVEGFAPLYDFAVTETLAGVPEAAPRITLWGQDGCNCNGPIRPLTPGDEYVVFYVAEARYFSCFATLQEGFANRYPIRDYPGCGPATLDLAQGMVSGPVKAGTNRMGLQAFRREIAACSELTEAPAPLEASVFPNPARTEVTVSFPETTIERAALYDVAGRLVYRQALGGLLTRHTFDVRQLPAGVYLIVLKTDTATRIKERVIVR